MLNNGVFGCVNGVSTAVFIVNQADVFAFFCDMSIEPIYAPSIPKNATKLATASTMQISILVLISIALVFVVAIAISACANVMFILKLLSINYVYCT